MLREYIWLDNRPVAMVDDTGASPVVYYVHTDQLGTPQKITDGSADVVWDSVFDPFGNMVASTGANWGTGVWQSFTWEPTSPQTMPLRFPGQYADSETALNQNWNRDYDPTIGRYVESDPIGISGGANTYAYVRSNPIQRYDSKGTDWFGCDICAIFLGIILLNQEEEFQHELNQPYPPYRPSPPPRPSHPPGVGTMETFATRASVPVTPELFVPANHNWRKPWREDGCLLAIAASPNLSPHSLSSPASALFVREVKGTQWVTHHRCQRQMRTHLLHERELPRALGPLDLPRIKSGVAGDDSWELTGRHPRPAGVAPACCGRWIQPRYADASMPPPCPRPRSLSSCPCNR